MSFGSDDGGEGTGPDLCPVAAATAALAAAVDALQAAELAGLSEQGLVAALDAVERQTRRLPSVRDALVAQVQRRDVATAHGARSTSAWLRSRFLIGGGEARTWLRGAERLSPRISLVGEPLEPVLPAVAAARAAGDLSTAQVKVIDDFDDELPSDLATDRRREVEVTMVGCARQLNPTELTRLGQRILDAIDPDGTEPAADEAHRRRGITIGPLRRGLARISGHVDAWTREAIFAVLASFADPDPVPSSEADQPVPADAPPTDARSTTAGATPSESGRETANGKPAAPCDSGAARDGSTYTEEANGTSAASCNAGDSAHEHAGLGAHPHEHANNDNGSATAGSACPPGPPGQGTPDDPVSQRALDADRRTHPQRLHDALGQALQRLLREGRLPRRGGTSATILLTVPLAVLEQRSGLVSTANGGDIPISEVIRRATDATVIPVVIDRVGNPLYLGRRHRFASPQQRQALHIRDGGCVIPGCTTSSLDCQAHHIIDWADRGRTDIDNLCLLCEFHHQRITSWTLELKYGRIWCTAPSWIDHDQNPQVNVYFRHTDVEALLP